MHLTLSVFVVLLYDALAVERHYTQDLDFVYIESVPAEYSINEQYVPGEDKKFRMEDMIQIENEDSPDDDTIFI